MNTPTHVGISLKINHDLQTADEWAADTFLWGNQPPSVNGVFPLREYPQGVEEEETRAALVRVLRSDRPLPRRLRTRIAELLDPNSKAEREFVLQFRREGKRSNRQMINHIGYYIVRRLKSGASMKRAVLDAADQFDLKERWVRECWRKYEFKDKPPIPVIPQLRPPR